MQSDNESGQMKEIIENYRIQLVLRYISNNGYFKDGHYEKKMNGKQMQVLIIRD